MDDRDERVRKVAHELWVLDGMPEGMALEHWYKADDVVRTEDFDAALANPNPAAEALGHFDRLHPDPAARDVESQPAPPEPRVAAPPSDRPARDPLLPPIAPDRPGETELQGDRP